MSFRQNERTSIVLALACSVAAIAAGPFGAQAQVASRAATNLPTLDVVLKPHSGAERVEYVDVRVTLQTPNAHPDRPFLSVPSSPANRQYIGYDSLRVTDSQGNVPVADKGVRSRMYSRSRTLSVERPTTGDVTLRYRTPVYVITSPIGPPYELRSEGRSMAGAGITFIMLPEDTAQYRTRLSWDLSEMPAGSIGMWAFGEGTVERVGAPVTLSSAFYAAGPLQRFSEGGFGFYWASEAPFDIAKLAADAGKLFKFYQTFFGTTVESYRVVMRRNPYPGGFGAALMQSFDFDYNPNSTENDADRMRHQAHEMAHTFLLSLQGAGAWYAEGLADHYADVLAVRAGFFTPTDFLERGVMFSANRYYPSPLRENPERADPYSRGRMYFASVNAKIRAKSGDRRSLDDVTRAIIRKRDQGERYDVEAWLKLVEAEIGPEARVDHEAFMAGKLVVPASNAFGPCFERQRSDIPAFELGFDEAGLRNRPGVARGLVPNSEAAKAGLRDGDEIVSSSPQLNAVQRDPSARITVQVRRDGQPVDITYLPRGQATIDVYRWVRVPNVPDANCRI